MDVAWIATAARRERDGAGFPPHDGLPVPDGHRGGPHPQVQQGVRVRVPWQLRGPPDAYATV